MFLPGAYGQCRFSSWDVPYSVRWHFSIAEGLFTSVEDVRVDPNEKFFSAALGNKVKKKHSENLNKSDVFAEDYAVIFSNYSRHFTHSYCDLS